MTGREDRGQPRRAGSPQESLGAETVSMANLSPELQSCLPLGLPRWRVSSEGSKGISKTWEAPQGRDAMWPRPDAADHVARRFPNKKT
jgi:hypothetical protein